MNFAEIQSALTAWLETVSGDKAIIENEPRPALIRRNGFWVVSPPNQIRQLGEDYPTYVDGVETVIGRREFVCVIRYICRDQAPTRNARYWLEQCRMSLKRTLVLEHLRAHGIGVVVMAPTVSYDAPFEGRLESIAAAELKLTCAVRDTLGSENIGHIDTVEITSDLDGTDNQQTITVGPPP